MNLIDKFHHWRRKRRWNKQYKSGRWESLKSDLEAKRYYQILDYLKEFAPDNPAILDIGCGDGVLNQRISDFPFDYFLGVDFSSVSIEKAKANNYPKAEFLAEDVLTFVPQRNFDVIVFNEAFYYIPETERTRVLNLMLKHLSPDGIIITSIFREGTNCWEYFKENPKLKERAFTTVTTKKETTYWKIGVYSKS
ncbi:MAG: class I SAM-dependent methyltransferase [Bacteroidota bacterium]